MEFTGKIVKKGTSTVHSLLVEYSVVFENDMPSFFNVKILKGDNRELVGISSYRSIKNQFTITFIDSAMLTASDRLAVFGDIERTIQKLFSNVSN